MEGVIVKGSAIFSMKGREGILHEVSSEIIRRLIEQNFRFLDQVETERRRTLALVKRLVKTLPVMGLFEDVPGLGPILASRFIAYVQTPFRFRTKRQLWKYSRLSIMERNSDGKLLSRKRLDGYGSGTLKYVASQVFQAAMRKRGQNLFKRSYTLSLARSGDPIHARLSAERKILATLLAMWKDGTVYDDNIDGKAA